MRIDKGWRLVAVAAAAGMAGGLMAVKLFSGEPALAQAPQGIVKMVSAREFRVVDDTGKTVSVWTARGEGARLTIGQYADKPEAVFGTQDNGDPGLSLYDRDGNNRADLRVASGNFPTIRLIDIKGKKSTLIGAHGLGLFNNRLRGRLILTSEGSVIVDLADQDTDLSTGLILAAKEKAALSLKDQVGKVVWSVP
jgi:hypothetical protein